MDIFAPEYFIVTAKKLVGKIHLWLGFTSGLVVLVLGITGCILVFEIEIRKLTESSQFVKVENKPYLPPSVLTAEAEKYFDGKKASSVEYRSSGHSALVEWYDEEHYKLVSLNPYSGKVIQAKNMNRDFFRIVLDGHFYLWLPPKIGQPIVASATLIFVIMMITGLILWWPKNKASRKQRFKIKWSARWRRKNYDLHNVLGFYMTWITIFISITGLVWGFEWFAKSVYWVSSGGKQLPPHVHPVSDTSKLALKTATSADTIWRRLQQKAKKDETIAIYYPLTDTDPLEGSINHRPGTYYDMDYYHYDQYTLVELPATGVYAEAFSDASAVDKIARMNYDIHVGAILGLPGKILAFFASLIAASLPVTGFVIWRGRKKKMPAVNRTNARELATVELS